MCDTTPLKLWLALILVAILLSAGLVLAAAITNITIFQIYNSPILMGFAGGAALVAALLCGLAISALDAVCKCAAGKCIGECSNLRNTLTASAAVLGILAMACFAAIPTSWIPFVGTVPMWVIMGALFIQAALIISAIVFMAMLDKCINAPPSSGSGPLTGEPTRPPLTNR